MVLFNLDQTKRSIPYIIERARDIDPINRRFVFIKPMSEIQDFRMLSISQRHQLLDAGLKDRDALVLKAVSKMISNHWIKHADHNLLEVNRLPMANLLFSTSFNLLSLVP